ncbi:MAG TPA: hypothetical protein VM186_14250 [Planctomycetota bacterium]|nr:hypothetical protein [Planctomycetota bacterium]
MNGSPCDTAVTKNGTRIDVPKLACTSVARQGGYEISILVPLSVLGIDKKAGQFSHEIAVSLRRAAGGQFEYVTFFDSFLPVCNHSERFGMVIVKLANDR